jgi:hypothetical protein
MYQTIITFLFTNKGPTPDPNWFLAAVVTFSAVLILISVFGKKIVSKDRFKALHKTLKKSSGMLMFFGIGFLVLLWFRLEALRFLSMKFWWLLLDIWLLIYLFKQLRYYLELRKRVDQHRTGYDD